MPCLCSKLEALIKVESQPDFFDGLTTIEHGNWVKLCQCQICGQLWSVDEWDKGSIAFAKKLSSNINWQTQDVEAQKSLSSQITWRHRQQALRPIRLPTALPERGCLLC